MGKRAQKARGTASVAAAPSAAETQLLQEGVAFGDEPEDIVCDGGLVEELCKQTFSELNYLLRLHGLRKSEDYLDKANIALLLDKSLRECPVCLSDEGEARTSPLQRSCLSEAMDEQAVRCVNCRAPFHRACAGQHALSAAERGVAPPLRCPVPGCRSVWEDDVIAWSLDSQQLELYHRRAAATEELRGRASSSSSSPSSSAASMSPRTEDAMRRLGIRRCPRCNVHIQKQPEGLITGCDKMTCRCGCMFCFKCGVEAAGGVARCRCVGAHHSFIPAREVLNNYRFGSDLLSLEEDITRRPRGPASKQTVARLQKELKLLRSDPPPLIYVHCDEHNLLFWDFLIEGPADTPYSGGWYWGRLNIPKDYPFWPPLIKFMTPNGRFETSTWMCRTLTDYHPEGWQPPWTISSLLIALLALMCGDSFLPGGVHPPLSETAKRMWARNSLAWNLRFPAFQEAFMANADVVERIKQQAPDLLTGPSNVFPQSNRVP